MITVSEFARVDPNWWNGLVRSSWHGTIYQTTYWAEYFRLYYGARPYFLVAQAGGGVRGLLLLFEMGRFPDRDAARPWLYQIKRPINALLRVFRWYSGPVVLDPATHDEVMASLLRKVEEIAVRDRVLGVEHGSLPVKHDQNVRIIAGALGFEVGEWATFVVDLAAPIETLWARLKLKSAKSAVKRAAQLGLRMYDATNDPPHAHARCEYEHSRANGIRPWPVLAYDAMRSALAPPAAYRMFAAEYESRLVAFTPVVFFHRTMHLVKPVQLPECKERRIPAGDFLMWEAIKFGHTQGLVAFDLAGVSPRPLAAEERGIRFFKSKWGGEYVAYSVLRKRYRSPLGRFGASRRVSAVNEACADCGSS